MLDSQKGKHTICKERLTVVQELLYTDDHKLEMNARTLKNMFYEDLQAVVASGGKCGGLLWTQVALWCECLPDNTHFIEGMNNMMQVAQAFAPFMKLPLLSSRIVGRLALLAETASTYKLAGVRPIANAVVKTACEYSTQAQDIMGDITRFRPADPEPTPVPPSKRNITSLKDRQSSIGK